VFLRTLSLTQHRFGDTLRLRNELRNSSIRQGHDIADMRAIESPVAAGSVSWDWKQWLLLLWAAGACILLLPAAGALWDLRRLKAASQNALDDSLEGIARPSSRLWPSGSVTKSWPRISFGK
jgi:hypothetical protein